MQTLRTTKIEIFNQKRIVYLFGQKMSELKKIIKYIPIIVLIVGGSLIALLVIALLNSIVSIIQVKFTASTNCDVHIIECLNTCNSRKICNLNITLMEPLYRNYTNDIYLLNVPYRAKNGLTICYFYENSGLALDSWLYISPILNNMKTFGSAIATISIVVAIFGILPIVFIKCLNRMNPINIVRGLF